MFIMQLQKEKTEKGNNRNEIQVTDERSLFRRAARMPRIGRAGRASLQTRNQTGFCKWCAGGSQRIAEITGTRPARER
jgi:hypothetical protein